MTEAYMGRTSKRPGVTEQTFKAGMRRLAAGVCLVTTRFEGRRHGFAATSVTSLSGAPPSLLVCVNQATSGHDPLVSAGRFGVNVLGQAHRQVVATFSTTALRHARFVEGAWDDEDAPILSDALAAFDCRLDQTLSYGTHTIFIGVIEAICLQPEAGDPLLYFDAKFQGLVAAPD